MKLFQVTRDMRPDNWTSVLALLLWAIVIAVLGWVVDVLFRAGSTP